MPTSLIRLALVVLLSGLAACSSSSSSTGGGGGATLTVAATPTRIRANGTATTVIHVEGATRAPIKLATTRGTFVDTGTKNVTVDATAADVTLQTCDGADPTCTGSISVTAVDGAFATGRVQVSLVGRETVCNDGIDNNGDGATDCDDTDCNALACRTPGGAAGTCQGLVCVATACASTETPETTCNDGVDNDCNTFADCLDTACDAKQCGTSGTSICQNKQCVDVAAGITLAVQAARTRIPAAPGATTTVTALVTKDGGPQGGVQVRLQTDLGSFAGAPGSGKTITIASDANGRAVATFVAGGPPGIATITASPVAIPLLTATTQIDMPALGEIRTFLVQYPVMGARFSGFQEQNNLAVQLFDLNQKTYPAGLTVTFTHLALGGSTLTAPHLPDVLGVCEAPWCVAYQTVTDDSGVARVTLYSGTVAGTVPVNATAAAGTDPARSYDLPAIAIIGASASGSHFSVVCSPENVPALAATNCSTSLVDASFTCVAVLKDRFNNILGRQTMVTFMSEGGAVGQPAQTPAYDPSKPPTDQADLGIAEEVFNTLGDKLPKDVPPHDQLDTPSIPLGDPRWEYSYFYDDGLCLPRRHNPRDGVVTVIAVAEGEEGFFDANGNGVYDPGEPFVDLPEPYVDYNDNNTRDPDEPFVDTNGNRVWDDANGVWDAHAKIWTQTVVAFTGLPEFLANGGNQIFSRWMYPGDVDAFPLPTPTPTIDPLGGYQEFYVGATDTNFNWLAGEKFTTYNVNDAGGLPWTNYYGAITVPDTKGFSYVYWPCDAADLTKCANDCGAANNPPPARCLMRSVLRGYRYGYTPRTSVPDPTGFNVLNFHVVVVGFDSVFPIY